MITTMLVLTGTVIFTSIVSMFTIQIVWIVISYLPVWISKLIGLIKRGWGKFILRTNRFEPSYVKII